MQKEIFAAKCGGYIKEKRGIQSQRSICRQLQLQGIDISEQSYSMKEAGKIRFTAEELLALSKILGFSFAEFVLYMK